MRIQKRLDLYICRSPIIVSTIKLRLSGAERVTQLRCLTNVGLQATKLYKEIYSKTTTWKSEKNVKE
jgi:hypothetical protein